MEGCQQPGYQISVTICWLANFLDSTYKMQWQKNHVQQLTYWIMPYLTMHQSNLWQLQPIAKYYRKLSRQQNMIISVSNSLISAKNHLSFTLNMQHITIPHIFFHLVSIACLLFNCSCMRNVGLPQWHISGQPQHSPMATTFPQISQVKLNCYNCIHCS